MSPMVQAEGLTPIGMEIHPDTLTDAMSAPRSSVMRKAEGRG